MIFLEDVADVGDLRSGGTGGGIGVAPGLTGRTKTPHERELHRPQERQLDTRGPTGRFRRWMGWRPRLHSAGGAGQRWIHNLAVQ